MGAQGAPATSKSSIGNGCWPLMLCILRTNPPGLGIRSTTHRFRRQRAVKRRMPFLSDLRIACRETILRKQSVAGAVWTAVAPSSACANRPIVGMAIWTEPPRLAFHARRNVCWRQIAIPRRMPFGSNRWIALCQRCASTTSGHCSIPHTGTRSCGRCEYGWLEDDK